MHPLTIFFIIRLKIKNLIILSINLFTYLILAATIIITVININSTVIDVADFIITTIIFAINFTLSLKTFSSLVIIIIIIKY